MLVSVFWDNHITLHCMGSHLVSGASHIESATTLSDTTHYTAASFYTENKCLVLPTALGHSIFVNTFLFNIHLLIPIIHHTVEDTAVDVLLV